MLHPLLKFAHLVGLMLMSAGLIGVFVADIRTRQARSLAVFAEAVRSIVLFYDGLVVPGALLLLGSGAWLILAFHGGWAFLDVPWLAGMIALFAFELVEGNTVTRLYFMKLRRLTLAALADGRFTAALERERGRAVPTFTHFLDLPVVLLIVSLGALRPATWLHFGIGLAAALAVATALTMTLPRLYAGDATARRDRALGRARHGRP